MSSNLNWVGNKVLDSNTSRQKSRSTYSMQTDPAIIYPPPSTAAQQVLPGYTDQYMQEDESMMPSVTQPGMTPPSMTPPSMTPPGMTPPGVTQPGVTQPGVMQPGITQQGPPPSTERGYIPYFLEQNIGKSVRAEFIIGSNQYTDKSGILSEVGINYFVLQDVNSRTYTMCDLYSVKFVTFLEQ